MTERRKMIAVPIGYSEGNIYFLEDALIAVSDFNSMYRLDMIYDKHYTVNKTDEVKSILNSIGYNL